MESGKKFRLHKHQRYCARTRLTLNRAIVVPEVYGIRSTQANAPRMLTTPAPMGRCVWEILFVLLVEMGRHVNVPLVM